MEKMLLKVSLRNRTVSVIALVVVAFAGGFVVRGCWQGSDSGHPHAVGDAERQVTMWTCSMHPQIRQPKPGKCPICFMNLVPVDSSGGAGLREISFSKDALKLMEIQTSPVERKFVEAQIRMVGKVDYDETRLKHITAWVAGRIDRLFVDFTGITVNQGNPMVELYSPELISSQAELLQAGRASKNITSETSELVKRSTLATLEGAREKLRLLGLSAGQIEDIERLGEPQTHITIYSPMGGTVIHKNATEGMYVDTGTPIYRVADLSHLWVKLDAYESDLPWLQYGQQVEFTTEAYRGEVFKGKITFIDPILSDKTRTIKVRVNVDNTDGRLKPDMFVRAVVRAKVAKGGKVMTADMAGKWVCPMHPSIVKDSAAACDICGMDLVTAESLGFVVADTSGEPPLVIPVSAALVTGRKLDRAVVYVKKPDTEKPTYEGREIVLGPRAGDYYLVKEGLAEGEVVVSKGNFKIDSALQIQAKPSMMNPEGQKAPMGSHDHNH